MTEMCFRCGTTERIIKHHISYDPEIIVDCCLSCHVKIHKKLSKITEKERYISVLTAVNRRYWRQKHVIAKENKQLLIIDDDLRKQINSLLS